MNSSTVNQIRLTPLLIITFINLLFIVKYSLRYLLLWQVVLVCLMYVAFMMATFFFFNKLSKTYLKSFAIAGFAIYVILDLAVLYKVNPLSTNVDRWSVITSFWDAVLEGKYPYLATSHLGNLPGPFPFYFLLAFPFYLIAEVGLFSLLGLLLLVLAVHRSKAATENKLIVIIFILASPALWWETFLRSTNLINSALLLLYLQWVMNINVGNTKKVIAASVIGGLMMSTRGLVLIPFCICFSHLFLNNINLKNVLLFGAGLLLAFGATFLPLALIDIDNFKKFNPFITQRDYFLPMTALLVIFVLGIIIGKVSKHRSDVFYYSGLMLFFTTLLYTIFTSSRSGILPAYLNSDIDISYFIFSMPFFSLSLFIPTQQTLGVDRTFNG